MSKRAEGPKRYDLEERTLQFAKHIRIFVKTLPRTIANEQDIRQLVRASGSVGANYIEANESLAPSSARANDPFCTLPLSDF
jgi:four helix bundle protein